MLVWLPVSVFLHARTGSHGLTSCAYVILCACVHPQVALNWIVYMYVHTCRVCVCVTAYIQLSWKIRVLLRGVRVRPCHPSDTGQRIVLLSWSIMSPKDWPCPGGRGPITRLITQAWLLLSGVVVPGHLSLLLSGGKEEESKERGRKRGKWSARGCQRWQGEWRESEKEALIVNMQKRKTTEEGFLRCS